MENDNSADSPNQIRLAAAGWAFRMIWRNCRTLVTGTVACTIIRGLVPAAFALVIRGLINSVTETVGPEGSGFETVITWLVLALTITLFDVLAQAASQLFSDRLKSDLTLKVNSLVIQHASVLDLPYMENTHNREVLDRVQQDPGSKLHMLFTHGISAILFAIQVASIAAVLTWLEPAVLLFAALFGFPFFVFQWRLAKAKYLTEHNRTNKRRWTTYFLSKVTSPDTVGEIKLLGLGGLLTKRFISTMEEFRDQDKKLQLRQFGGSSLFGIITTISFYALFGRVVFRVYEGSLTVGDLAIFGGAVVRLRSSMDGGIRHTARGYEQTLFIADLREFLASNPVVANTREERPQHVDGNLSVNDVSFSYPDTDQVVLKDISFQVTAGETIAIVGENGSGKSTLAKLLVRLYDVDQGTITLDGQDIRQYQLEWLQSRVALLGQSFGRYEASVAENLAYGDWDRLADDRKEIERLAEATGISHIVESLPDGLDTTLGREFSEHDLSGGQWQLLAIARTLARRASVLILDEPTSNIDARSEFALFNAIGKLTERITTIIISHRFSTIRLAGKILVMHKGRIVETGSHEELMSAGGRYKRLYELHEHYRIRSRGRLATRKIFSYEGLSIRVESEADEDIRWLSEFLDPCFTEQNGRAEVEVSLKSDQQYFDSLMGFGPGEGIVDAYILDTSVISYPVWNTPGPELVFYDEKKECFYLVEGNRVVLLNRAYSTRSRIGLMRVVREFAMGIAQKSGGRFLHASSFSIGGKAAIITGPREAGKTSLITYILSNSSTDFLANDRLLVRESGEAVKLRGMPTIISVRSGTLKFFPDLFKSMLDQKFNAHLTLQECDDSIAADPAIAGREKHGMSSRQYCSLLTCNPVGESKGVTLLFPSQTGRPGGISLISLEKDETRERLAHCLFNNIGPDRLSDVFTPREPDPDNSDIIADEWLCEWLSSNLTAYECRLGTDAYKTPKGANVLVETVVN